METEGKRIVHHAIQKGRCYHGEWEKQKTVWLSWPHNVKEWGEQRLPKIRKFYNDLINIVLDFQDVNLILTSEELLDETKNIPAKDKKHSCKKIVIPNDDIWIRDYGPFFIERYGKKGTLILDFGFNAWGGKFPPWNRDDTVPKEIAFYLGCESESYPLILEGGALEFSGDGLVLTTEECILNKNRNSEITKESIESVIKNAFGVNEVIFLKKGLVNDHTDGHIDNVARFIDKRKVLVARSFNRKNENFDHLIESENILKNWSHPQRGYKLDVIELPLPECNDSSMPYSYANFIFINNGVIVPLYNCQTDEMVLKIFKLLFPERNVIGIDCNVLIEEGGSLHCMTKQESLIH